MANMLRNKRRSCKCCGEPEFTRGQARRQDKREWLSDFLSEANYQEREYPPGYDHFPEGGFQHPSELDDVTGVQFIPARH